jgi:hypothetical protein
MPNGRHADVFSVEEPDGPRWQDALQLLADGHPIACMGLSFSVGPRLWNEPGEHRAAVRCAFPSRHNSRSITADQAAVEIENAEAGVAEIRERSPEFARLLSGRPILYELLDQYGEVRLAFKDRSEFHFQGLGRAAPG